MIDDGQEQHFIFFGSVIGADTKTVTADNWRQNGDGVVGDGDDVGGGGDAVGRHHPMDF